MAIPKPQHCKSCVGYQWSNCRGYSAVDGTGVVPLLIVGEASGRTEEQAGKPFVGVAGQVLDKAFRLAGLKRSDYSITNVIRCRPPNNELRGQPYERAALDHCRVYLDEVVAERKPTVILALGDTALSELSTVAGSISALRGFVLQSVYDIPIIGTYHPSHLARGAMHLFGVFMHDLRTAAWIARHGVPAQPPTNYNLAPTVAEAITFLNAVLAEPTLFVSYDLETRGILGQREPSGQETPIQIQFATVHTTIVLPWTPPYLPVIAAILATTNPKFDWNGRQFDRKILRRLGFVLGGELHDLMNAHGHLQPSFVSQKDAGTDEDKGVPAKLMSLQSCTSFYFPQIAPWKHKGMPVWDWRWAGQQLPLPLRLYGGRDALITLRVGMRLFTDLKAAGLWDGYLKSKHRVSFVLDKLSATGLPIDRTRQQQLATWIAEQQTQLLGELQTHIPDEIKLVHPKAGKKSDLVRIDGVSYHLNRVATDATWCEIKGRTFLTQPFNTDDGVQHRWCELLPFNPSSSQQMLGYIRWKGYRVPTRIDDSSKETTGQAELERLFEETGDEVLKHTVEIRRLGKVASNYTSGDWVPGSDGRVHPQYGFGTASGQKTSRRPNAMNFPAHGDLAKRAKACIRAEPGHTFVKRDYRSFHARSLGWLAEDGPYYSLADYDVHSYVTSHFLHLPIASHLLGMSNGELRAALADIKRTYPDVRNQKAKRAILGLGFGMGVNKLYLMNPDAFGSPLEAQALITTIQQLFPAAFVEFPKAIEKRIRQSPRLVSPVGAHRWIWSGDQEEAVSFLPANIAHAHIDDSLLLMDEAGILDRYQFCGFIHDCVIFHCPVGLVEQCAEESRVVMERESTVLINSLGPFQCMTDLEIGPDWASMKTKDAACNSSALPDIGQFSQHHLDGGSEPTLSLY